MPTDEPKTEPTSEMLRDQACMQLFLAGMQGILDNQRMAQNTLLAFQKDLFQGGQAELGNTLATLKGLNSSGGGVSTG